MYPTSTIIATISADRLHEAQAARLARDTHTKRPEMPGRACMTRAVVAVLTARSR